MVWESTNETAKVINTPSRMMPVSSRAERRLAPSPEALPMKNIVIIEMRVGNRPLQGTKLLVMIAHPNPMHMVSACFPQARHRWKPLSRLKAMRGRYPESSNKVKSGKKIAMGGSMTETTHASVR